MKRKIKENSSIPLPTIEEQKETVRMIETKIRTSFELTEDSLKKLEGYAQKREISTSEALSGIIRGTSIYPDDKNQKRLKNFTIDEFCMERLNQLGESLIPVRFAGKRGINKSQIVELLIQKHFELVDESDKEISEKFGEDYRNY